MTAVAMTSSIDSEILIEEAKKLLAENRTLTGTEQQEARNALYQLGQTTDTIGFATLNAIYTAIDKAADARLAESLLAKKQAALEGLAAHRRARTTRFANLSPAERVAWRLSDKRNDDAIGRALIEFARGLQAELLQTDATTPDNFEPELL